MKQLANLLWFMQSIHAYALVNFQHSFLICVSVMRIALFHSRSYLEKSFDFPYFIIHCRLLLTREVHFCDYFRQLRGMIIAIDGDRRRDMFMAKVLAYGFDLFAVLACLESQVDSEMPERMWWVIGKASLLRTPTEMTLTLPAPCQ